MSTMTKKQRDRAIHLLLAYSKVEDNRLVGDFYTEEAAYEIAAEYGIDRRRFKPNRVINEADGSTRISLAALVQEIAKKEQRP